MYYLLVFVFMNIKKNTIDLLSTTKSLTVASRYSHGSLTTSTPQL